MIGRSKVQQVTSHVGLSLPAAQGKRQTSVKLPGPTKELKKEKMPIIATKANEDQKQKVTSRCNIKSQRRQVPKNHNPDIQNDLPTAASAGKSLTFDKKIALKTRTQGMYTQRLNKLQPSEPRRKGKTYSATKNQVKTQEKASLSSREHYNNSCTKIFAHNWHDPYKIEGDNPYCEYLSDSPALTEDHTDTLKMDNEWRTPCEQ